MIRMKLNKQQTGLLIGLQHFEIKIRSHSSLRNYSSLNFEILAFPSFEISDGKKLTENSQLFSWTIFITCDATLSSAW